MTCAHVHNTWLVTVMAATTPSTSSSDSVDVETTTTCTDAGDASDAGNSSSDVPSLLGRLRAASQSVLMRKRKVRVNLLLPHTGARRKKPACLTDPKGVSVLQRVNKFSGEMLINSAEKLFCSACREELSLKLSIVKNHVDSAKHSRHKQKLKEKTVGNKT